MAEAGVREWGWAAQLTTVPEFAIIRNARTMAVLVLGKKNQVSGKLHVRASQEGVRLYVHARVAELLELVI